MKHFNEDQVADVTNMVIIFQLYQTIVSWKFEILQNKMQYEENSVQMYDS